MSVSSPNSISNDLSQLVFNGSQEAKWELWINYITTNSLSTQWDSRMDFGGSSPDLTVTGQYKFACSTIDGTNIIAKQVYPTVYRNQYQIPQFLSVTLTLNMSNVNTIKLFLSSATRTNAVFFQTYGTTPIIIETSFYAASSSTLTNSRFFSTLSHAGVNNRVGDELQMGPIRDYFIGASRFATTVKLFWDNSSNISGYSASTYPNDGILVGIHCIETNSVDTISVFNERWRYANELEIKAYNAGWRPQR